MHIDDFIRCGGSVWCNLGEFISLMEYLEEHTSYRWSQMSPTEFTPTELINNGSVGVVLHGTLITYYANKNYNNDTDIYY